ncbi:glycosyltransferase family 2 protein [candidate division KSB1 bacterium]|nr:glycosyltransferase family 2 protein [candidate division KSB1 bacterium]
MNANELNIELNDEFKRVSTQPGAAEYVASPEMIKKVSVVILNWNRKDNVLDCLSHIFEMECPLYQVIVVDNASTDGSVDAIREAYPDVVIVENDKNYGAPEGKNIGLRKSLESDMDVVYMVDNDIVVARDSLTQLMNVLEEIPDAGIVGAKMYDYSKPDILLSAGGIIDFTENVSRGRGDCEKDVGQFEKTEEVDYLWGGAMIATREVLEKVGLFDSEYLGYWFEDSDFSVRVRKAGYKVIFCGKSKVWHRPHKTIEQFSFRKKYLATRNAIRFMKKHATAGNWAKYMLYAVGGIPYAAVRDLILRGNPMGAFGKAMGIIDGLLGNDKRARQMLNMNKKG